MCRKGGLQCIVFQTSSQQRKNGPWAWNTFLPWEKEPSHFVLDLLPSVGIFSLLPSQCVFLCSVSLLCHLALGQPHCYVCAPRGGGGVLPREGCMRANCPLLPGENHRPWETTAHHWSWSCSVSSPSKAMSCPELDSFMCDSNFKMQLTEVFSAIPGGWHNDDLCYLPCSLESFPGISNSCMMFCSTPYCTYQVVSVNDS